MSDQAVRGRLENRTELAKTFGITVVTLDSWVSAGCPVVTKGGRGREYQFDTASVAQWREQHVIEVAQGTAGMDIREARRRKLSAEATLAEIERDLRLGTIVPVNAVIEQVGAEYSIIRDRMLGLAGGLALQLLGAKSAAEIDRMLRKEVTAILAHLSGAEDIAARAVEAD